MTMNTIKFHLEGTRPLMMHSDRFANPLDPDGQNHKEITAKRKKTDEDQRFLMRSDWMGALYYKEKTGIYIPGQNIYATLFNAAKLRKLGVHFKRAVYYPEDAISLQHEGPKDPNKLYELPEFRDIRGVVIGGKRIMRCRPIFQDWALDVSIPLDVDMLNPKELIAIAKDAGDLIGLCDYRPRFGRFSVEVVG